MSQPKLRAADNKVEAITALTTAATIRKLLRVPGEDGTTNFEVISVSPITLQGNGHNTEVVIRVDLAYGQSGLPIPESDRYSIRRETCHRIDLREAAKVAGVTLNEKGQIEGTVTDVASLNTLLGTALTDDDVTINPVTDVMWVRAKPTSLGYTGQLTIASGGTGPVDVLPTGITVTLSAEDVNVGATVTATVEVAPPTATDKTYTVVSSDPLTASVNADGTVITGVKAGTAKITYTSVAAPTVKMEKTVNVKTVPVVKPTGIQATNVPPEMTVGDVVTNVVVEITPADATDKTFTATTDDEYILKTSADGKTLTAIGFGTGHVTYTANGDNTIKQTLAVSVVEPPPPLPDRFQVDGAPATLEFGASAEFDVMLFPLNALQEWDVVSSEPTIVEVTPFENHCKVTGLTTGKSTITITARHKPELVWTQDITVGEDPNLNASVDAKITFEPDFGSDPGTFHAGYVNVGDMVNVILRPSNLVKPMPITLKVPTGNATITYDEEQVLQPGVDLIIPVILESITNAEAITILVYRSDEILTGMRSFYGKDPAVIPTDLTLSPMSADWLAGSNYNIMATLAVDGDYIKRDVKWTTSAQSGVELHQYTAELRDSMDVRVSADIPVGTTFTITCTIDGLTKTTDNFTIVAAEE